MAGKTKFEGEGLDPGSGVAIYRQLADKLRVIISSGEWSAGERIPGTRDLASQFGLNRGTVAAAFELLEKEGLIRSHVGKGSFVVGEREASRWGLEGSRWGVDAPRAPAPRWDAEEGRLAGSVGRLEVPESAISFAASRPSEMLFPLDEFRETCREVIDSDEAANILQLGAPSGYGPLRRHLLHRAREAGVAGDGDDVLVTTGCQQAFDLIQRVTASRGETVLMEDPVYPGLRNVFQRGGARVIGVPLETADGAAGLDLGALKRMLEREHPRLLVLTPNFQNPTGLTMPEDARREVLAMVESVARKTGMAIIENDLYGALRYRGNDVPWIKKLDKGGATVLLSSYSKIAFPGLRVGWAIGPRHIIARLTEAKESSDLHSDQLGQAVALRFAQSGRLARHCDKMVEMGRERLDACLEACVREFPVGIEFTVPEGGMNLWVTLPEPLDAGVLAARAAGEGVGFLPGRYFAVTRPQTQGLRLSFAGLEPAQIDAGMAVLGRIFRAAMDGYRTGLRPEPGPAMV